MPKAFNSAKIIRLKSIIYWCWYLPVLFVFNACNNKASSDTKKNKPTQTIVLGEYQFKFPKGFKKEKETDLDSDVATVTNGKITFNIDFGYYSNPLEKSIQEYMDQMVWKWNALVVHGKEKDHIDMDTQTKFVTLLRCATDDSMHYTLFFKFKSDTLHYDLEIPDEVRNTKVNIDTMGDHRYKFVITNEYIGLSAKNLKSYNKSINSSLSLTITAKYKNWNEVKLIRSILKTCKPVVKRKA